VNWFLAKNWEMKICPLKPKKFRRGACGGLYSQKVLRLKVSFFEDRVE